MWNFYGLTPHLWTLIASCWLEKSSCLISFNFNSSIQYLTKQYFALCILYSTTVNDKRNPKSPIFSTHVSLENVELYSKIGEIYKHLKFGNFAPYLSDFPNNRLRLAHRIPQVTHILIAIFASISELLRRDSYSRCDYSKAGLGIRSFAQRSFAHLLIRSFAHFAQIKWVTVSDLLRSLKTNEQLWANCSGR